MSSENTPPPDHRGGSSRDRQRDNRSSGRRGRGRRNKKREPGDAPPVSVEALASIQHVLDNGEYIVFDIETTGGNPEKNGITEIFAIRFKDGVIVDTFGTLVNPEIPIPPIVRRMTGINNQMVRGAPKIQDVMPDFIKFAAKGVLVSHNTIGDMKFVRYFAKQACEVVFENFFLCTHLLVERLAPETPDKSLKGLAEYFKLATGELHRAEADAYVTLDLFKVLLGRLKDRSVKRIEEGIRLQGDMESGLRLGWGVTEAKVQDVPDGPGIYRLYDHEHRLLFLSSTSHLEREMAKIRALDQLPRPLLRLVLRSYDVDWLPAANVYQSLLQESDELDKHAVSFKPVEWHQRTIQALYVADDEEGVRIGIGPIEERSRFAFGPVRDRRIASEFLEAVAPLLGGKMERRGLILPKQSEALFLDLLAGKLPERFAGMSKKARSMRLWFKPTERRDLKTEAERLKALLDIKMPSRLTPMLDHHGIIVVPDAQQGSWQVYTIVGSRPRAMTTFKGDPEAKLKGGEFAAKYAEGLARDASQLKVVAMSQGDVNRANATLWWIHNGRFEGRFVSLAELQGCKPETH